MTIEEDRRAQILRSVAQCVAEDGMQGTTIRRIAERANVSTGMITYYYKNKRELLIETLAEAGRKLTRRLDQLAGPEPTRERLEAWLNLIFTYRHPDDQPFTFWIQFFAEATSDPELRRYYMELQKRSRQSFAEAFRLNTPEGASNAIDPLLAADLILILVNGLAVRVTLDDETMSPARGAEIAQTTLSLLLGGSGNAARNAQP